MSDGGRGQSTDSDFSVFDDEHVITTTATKTTVLAVGQCHRENKSSESFYL